MRNGYYQLAQNCMINIKDEADAIKSYNEMINDIMASNIPEDEREELVNLLHEIIDDELDHIRILHGIYCGRFDISPDAASEGQPIVTEDTEVKQDV